MKRLFLLFIPIVFVVMCQKQNNVQLEPGSPAYELAVACAEKMAVLHPDSNTVLASAKSIQITNDALFQHLYATMGSQSERFKSFSESVMKRMVQQTAGRLAEKELLYKQAKKSGIKVKDAEVDSLILQYARQQEGYSDIKTFLAEKGIDYDYFWDDVKSGIMIDRYLADIVLEKRTVTEEEILMAYEKMSRDTLVSVQHILLLTRKKSEREKEEIKEKMASILKEARSGVDFGELAKKYSEDPGSKDKGGLYENFGRHRMVKPFEDASFTVPVGEISDIVETRYGFHIIKVLSRGANDKPLDEIRPEIEQSIRNKSANQIKQQHVEELKEKSEFKLHV